jgi:hypothetical protein
MSPSEIQDLISYIGHRFDAVDRRFDAMEIRFAEFRHEMLGHLDAIYRRLERLTGLEARVDQIQRRLPS